MDRFTYWNPTKLIFEREKFQPFQMNSNTTEKTYCLYMVEAALNETVFMTKLSAF